MPVMHAHYASVFAPGSKPLTICGSVYEFKGLSPRSQNLLTHHLHWKCMRPWCDHNCRNVHNCRNQPQLSQKTTIVAKNHNCRNANHNCRNFFEKVFDYVNINTWLKHEVSLGFLDLNSLFHNIVAILPC